MHVSVTLTATSQVRVDQEGAPAITLASASVDEAGPPTPLSPPTRGARDRGELTSDAAPPAPAASREATPASHGSTIADDEAVAREGLYGPMHWLDDRHVSSLLSPYICEGWDTCDYARFSDLAGQDARRLRSLLPPLAREDRQNNAPRITDLLRAATRIDGLTLDGYVIRAPRWDERVSIDTVCVPESAIVTYTGLPIEVGDSPTYRDWLTLAEVLGLDREAIPPDEMRFLVRDTTAERWWWAWWD